MNCMALLFFCLTGEDLINRSSNIKQGIMYPGRLNTEISPVLSSKRKSRLKINNDFLRDFLKVSCGKQSFQRKYQDRLFLSLPITTLQAEISISCLSFAFIHVIILKFITYNVCHRTDNSAQPD